MSAAAPASAATDHAAGGERDGLARALLAASVLTAALVWATVTGGRPVAALGAALAIGSLGWQRQPRVSAPLQTLLMLAGGLTAAALTGLLPPEGAVADRALRPAWAILGSTALLMGALRTHLLRPEGGVALTLGLGLIVFVAAGSVRSGPLYPALMLVHVPLLFAAARFGDPERPRWSALRLRHRAALAFILAFSAVCAGTLAVALPRLYDRANAWALRWISDRVQSGFHDGPMALGALDDLLLSNAVVLRVEGPVGPLLRGNAYTVYARERWMAPQRREEIAFSLPAVIESSEPESGIIRHVSGDTDRFFLPLGATPLAAEPRRLGIDANAIVRARGDEAPEWIRVRRGGEPRFPAAAPTDDELQIPAHLVEPLQRLARAWTAGAQTSSARVAALQSRLERGYTYSLRFERGGPTARRSRDLDPVLHFLVDEPVGHCQYFASALALLARAVGVPTRLVTGYRVIEHNRLGGYHIVRERHAHAWVEAYLPERGWVSYDPSPLRSLEGESAATTPLFPALLDWTALALQRHGPEPLLVALVVAMAGVQLRRMRAGRTRGRAAPRATARPPRELTTLLARLGELGWPRAGSETLESYASRLSGPAEAPGSPLARADRLLRRFAAHRYGDLGDAGALCRDVRAWLARQTLPERDARRGANRPR